MSKDLSQKIIESIKHAKLAPKPKWQFLLKRYVIWLMTVISLVIGSLAFAVIIYMISTNDWDAYEHISDNWLAFTLINLPYFWLVWLAIFVVVAYYIFKHTAKGYKWHLYTIILGSVVVSVLVGSVLYQFGLGCKIDQILSENIPVYYRFFNQENRRLNLWSRPEQGLLSGIVVEVFPEDGFQLRDLEQKIWLIEINNLEQPMPIVESNNRLRVIGYPLEDFHFQAHHILPWYPQLKFLPPGRRFERNFFPLTY